MRQPEGRATQVNTCRSLGGPPPRLLRLPPNPPQRTANRTSPRRNPMEGSSIQRSRPTLRIPSKAPPQEPRHQSPLRPPPARELQPRLALEDNNPTKAIEEADKALAISPTALNALAIRATIDLLDDKKD